VYSAQQQQQPQFTRVHNLSHMGADPAMLGGAAGGGCTSCIQSSSP
jgi:hypothetical protein